MPENRCDGAAVAGVALENPASFVHAPYSREFCYPMMVAQTSSKASPCWFSAYRPYYCATSAGDSGGCGNGFNEDHCGGAILVAGGNSALSSSSSPSPPPRSVISSSCSGDADFNSSGVTSSCKLYRSALRTFNLMDPIASTSLSSSSSSSPSSAPSSPSLCCAPSSASNIHFTYTGCEYRYTNGWPVSNTSTSRWRRAHHSSFAGKVRDYYPSCFTSSSSSLLSSSPASFFSRTKCGTSGDFIVGGCDEHKSAVVVAAATVTATTPNRMLNEDCRRIAATSASSLSSSSSDHHSRANNVENFLPRIIKPRKRKKKERKPNGGIDTTLSSSTSSTASLTSSASSSSSASTSLPTSSSSLSPSMFHLQKQRQNQHQQYHQHQQQLQYHQKVDVVAGQFETMKRDKATAVTAAAAAAAAAVVSGRSFGSPRMLFDVVPSKSTVERGYDDNLTILKSFRQNLEGEAATTIENDSFAATSGSRNVDARRIALSVAVSSLTSSMATPATFAKFGRSVDDGRHDDDDDNCVCDHDYDDDDDGGVHTAVDVHLKDEEDADGDVVGDTTSTAAAVFCNCRYCDPQGVVWDVKEKRYSANLMPPPPPVTDMAAAATDNSYSRRLLATSNANVTSTSSNNGGNNSENSYSRVLTQHQHELPPLSSKEYRRSSTPKDLQISSQIVTSLNGHRDIEIKFYLSSNENT